jgi:PhoPQ-activated pathogenicity-related protein
MAFLTGVCAMLLAGLVGIARADFAAYLAKPEPVYRWEKRGEKDLTGGKVYDLHLVSQTWQGIVWEHRLQLFVPTEMTAPTQCTLLNTGGSGGVEESVLGLTAARMSGSPFAILYNIPNQPIYGKTEDALIVHTWMKFLETGDETWPLHFPMAKAVLKAMDALQAFSKQAGMKPLKEFIITGASKRGWTTWMVGASKDPRVKAIAPMVIDVLNVAAQVRHQLESYGKPSEQIEDYSAAGLLPLIESPKGKRLMELEDPYSYRSIITMPKLIILGTNDRYWTQDALNLYWDGLVGPKWVAYIPNSGHGLEDRGRLLNVLTAFVRAQGSAKPFPTMKWTYKDTSDGVTLTVRTPKQAKAARLFYVTAPTRDFRDHKWASTDMTGTGTEFTASYKTPASGFAAVYGELVFERDGKPFTLTTQIRILGKP